MNYYLDQEFHEYFKKPIGWLPTIGKFNKPYHTIELISIGIVAEDGREYYAVCNEFDLKASERNKWLDQNVITPIAVNFYQKESAHAKYHHSGSLTMKNFLKWKGKSKEKISKEIIDFCGHWSEDGLSVTFVGNRPKEPSKPAFYGYYADYDWVVFCSLFGSMMDLPEGFPMYCRDLKQILDESAEVYEDHFTNGNESAETKLSWIKNKANYPKQKNEHNALADAKWNKKLHEFLKTL